MKTQMKLNRIISFGAGLALALALSNPMQSNSAEPAEGKRMDGKMMERCQNMMKHREMMKGEATAQDTKLKADVAAMNSAADEGKKSELMAAVVTQLVEQRAAMHVRMASMHEEMMSHMMEHMQMGKESMSQCPMMHGMKGRRDGSENHKEHHDK